MKKELFITLSLTLFFITTYVQSQTLDWAKSFGGDGIDRPISIVNDDLGNVYTLGGFSDTVDFDPNSGTSNVTSNGSTDVYIQKLDENGNFIWIKSLGGTGQDYGYSIEIDNSNNIYVVGAFANTVDFDLGAGIDNVSSNGNLDAFLLKLNSDGDVLLKRTFGGIGKDELNSIELNSSNEIYLAGQFQKTVDFDPGVNETNINAIASNGTDLFILKLDTNADFLWVKNIGGNGNDPMLQPGITGAKEVVVDAGGNIYLTGFYTRNSDFDPGVGVSELISNGPYHMFVLKLDTNGNYVWAKSVGGIDETWGNSITIDNSGNVYSTGYFDETADFDPGVGVNNLISSGNRDVYVQKLDSNGDFIWAKSFGSTNQDIGTSIITDSSGNVYISGYFSDTVDFDPGNSVVNLSSVGSDAIFILRLDTNGNFSWVQSLGSNSFVPTITTDTLGGFYITGSFINTMTFDFGNGSNNFISNGYLDTFILKFSINSLSNDNNEMLRTISYFPNPTNEELTIISRDNFKISVYDINGKIVKRVTKNSREFSFSLKNLSPGLYLLKGENSTSSFSKRIIVN